MCISLLSIKIIKKKYFQKDKRRHDVIVFNRYWGKKNLSEKSNKNIEPVGFLLLFKNNKNKNELNK